MVSNFLNLIFLGIYVSLWSTTDPNNLILLCSLNIISSVFYMFSVRKSPYLGPLSLLFIYMSYSILIGRYVNTDLTVLNNIIDYSFDFIGLFSIFVFVAIIDLLKAKKITKIELVQVNDYSNPKRKFLVSFITLACGLFMSTFFIDTSVAGVRASYTPYYEYSIVFYIVSLYYSKFSTKTFQYLVISIVVFVAFRDILLGHRATAIQLLLAIYIIFYSKYYSFSLALISLFAGIVFVNIAAGYRGSFELSLDTEQGVNYLFGDKLFASDTIYYAFIASLTFIATRTYFSLDEIWSMFSDFVISLLIPGTYGQNLYQISSTFFAHENGGILPIYLFFYLGFFAIPISSVLVSLYFRNYSKLGLSTFWQIISIYVFVTTPRWLLYSPNQLLRGALIMAFVIFMIFIFNSILNLLFRSRNV